MLSLKHLHILSNRTKLQELPKGKCLINTINAHSYNTAQKDELFAEALSKGDALIPDGVSIVKACKWLKAKSQPTERIAGWDLFEYEMRRIERESEELTGRTATQESRLLLTNDSPYRDEASSYVRRKVMFMGSSEKVLSLIKQRAAKDYPHLEVITYSPPYKPEFSDEDNRAIVSAINEADPDLLWIGMTAPKQEKWTYSHWKELNIHCHVGTIGAVFDFYAGTVKRAPLWWQEHGLEWLYRLLKEPKRMWRRYLVGNTLFLWNVTKEDVKM